MVAGTIKLYTKRSVFNIITSELEREPLSISSLDVILVCVVLVHTISLCSRNIEISLFKPRLKTEVLYRPSFLRTIVALCLKGCDSKFEVNYINKYKYTPTLSYVQENANS